MSAITIDRNDRLLVFAPHPDDESLACAGLILRARHAGARVQVVVATDGEANPWPQRMMERRWRLGPQARRRWGMLRGDEARRALACLGIAGDDAAFLHWPDQGLTTLLAERANGTIAVLRETIRRSRPTLLAMPSIHDTHPDHSALGLLLHAALLAEGCQPRLLCYRVHGSHGLADAAGIALRLGPCEQAAKRDAVLSHASQAQFGRARLLRRVAQDEIYLSTERQAPRESLRWRWRFRTPLPLRLLSVRRLLVVGIDAAGRMHCARLRLAGGASGPRPRVDRNAARHVEFEVAPLWPGPLWLLAKLENGHRVNVYDVFGWAGCQPDADSADAGGAEGMPGSLPLAVAGPQPDVAVDAGPGASSDR